MPETTDAEADRLLSQMEDGINAFERFRRNYRESTENEGNHLIHTALDYDVVSSASRTAYSAATSIIRAEADARRTTNAPRFDWVEKRRSNPLQAVLETNRAADRR